MIEKKTRPPPYGRGDKFIPIESKDVQSKEIYIPDQGKEGKW